MEKEKLKIEHYKSVSIYFMAILGGQITLLGSMFSHYAEKWAAIYAIVFMLLASLIAMSISDAAVQRVSDKPVFKYRCVKWLYESGSTSTEVEYIKSMIAAISFVCSFGFFSWFVFNGL